MAYKMTLTTWAILAMFIVGLLFSSTYTARNVQEAFQGLDSPTGASNKNRCPIILIQKGTELYLHNSRLANVPGVNPLKFNNLEDYVEFTEGQRSQGIRCPVLYMQHSFDAQGKPIYKIRPGPLDLQGGLPPVASGVHINDSDSVSPGSSNANADYIENADEPPGNLNSYPAYDPMDHNAGRVNDPIKKPLKGLSANPMASNWAGDKYTTSLIDAGKYEGNEVNILIP